MRDGFEEDDVVGEGEVVEQDEVRVELAHIADVRHDRDAKFLQNRLAASNSPTPATRTASTWVKPTHPAWK